MFTDLRGSHLFLPFSDWLWKRRIFYLKVSVRSLAGWNSAALMLGKAQWHSPRQLHQQLRSALAKTAGALHSGPDHRGPASGSGIYSCWGPQWQRLLGASCLWEEFLAKGILLALGFSTLALSGSGAGVLASGTRGQFLGPVPQCRWVVMLPVPEGRHVHIFREPGSESLGLTTAIRGPRMGRYSSGTNCGGSNGTPCGWWVPVLPLAPGHR